MKIRLVTPIVSKEFLVLTGMQKYAATLGSAVEISVVALDQGPASIESEFDEALAVPDTIVKVMEAERDGCDAVVINCFADPGVQAAREAMGIPVLGAGESSMHLATILGETFSIVTVLKELLPMIRNRARRFGVADRLASVRAVDIPVLELHRDEARLRAALVEEAARAVEEDGAHVIVLGCTGLTGLAEEVQAGLARRGLGGIPVLDPLESAIKLAEALVGLQVTHSKRTYPYPPVKEIVGYDEVQRPMPRERVAA